MINNYDPAVLSEKVAYLEAAIKNAGIELPEVTTDDNGKTLQVVAGKWAKGMIIPELPTVTESDNGKALQVVNGAWATGAKIPVSRVVQTITANEYASYVLALTALKDAYSALSDDEKKRSAIIRNDSIIYRNTALSGGFGVIIPASATSQTLESFFLDTTSLYISTAFTSSTATTSDKSSDAQTHKLELVII